MNILIKAAVTTAILAVMAAPAIAHQPQSHGNNGTAHSGQTPGPHASLPAKAKAYGRYCQGFSKKRVANTKGTPFSRCVTAMARLGSGRTDSPRFACRDMSKRHVEGQTGTPFSRCVVAGAQLQADQQNEDESAS